MLCTAAKPRAMRCRSAHHDKHAQGGGASDEPPTFIEAVSLITAVNGYMLHNTSCYLLHYYWACLSVWNAVRELATRAQSASPLGQYAAPLAAVRMLVSIEPIARALVGLPTFKPNLKAGTGRALQLPGSSWLGPFFSVSCYPDDLIKAEPDVRTVFAGATSGQRTQVGGAVAAGFVCAFQRVHADLY